MNRTEQTDPTLRRRAADCDVMLLLEGTFPFVSGGVSSWVNQIIRAFPDLRFGICFVGSRRNDYDESRLVEEYDPRDLGEGKLGAFVAHNLELKAKEGVDVAYPVVKLWVDKASGNILKRQEFALSGRLLRTALYPKWQKLFSEAKKADVWFPGEIRIFDEVETSNSTLVLFKQVELKPLDANLFTKAWLESKSR